MIILLMLRKLGIGCFILLLVDSTVYFSRCKCVRVRCTTLLSLVLLFNGCIKGSLSLF